MDKPELTKDVIIDWWLSVITFIDPEIEEHGLKELKRKAEQVSRQAILAIAQAERIEELESKAMDDDSTIQTLLGEKKTENWLYETCKNCGREQRLSWSVNQDTWKLICGKSTKTLCLECFLKRADEKKIYIDILHIHFYGVIMNCMSSLNDRTIAFGMMITSPKAKEED